MQVIRYLQVVGQHTNGQIANTGSDSTQEVRKHTSGWSSYKRLGYIHVVGLHTSGWVTYKWLVFIQAVGLHTCGWNLNKYQVWLNYTQENVSVSLTWWAGLSKNAPNNVRYSELKSLSCISFWGLLEAQLHNRKASSQHLEFYLSGTPQKIPKSTSSPMALQSTIMRQGKLKEFKHTKSERTPKSRIITAWRFSRHKTQQHPSTLTCGTVRDDAAALDAVVPSRTHRAVRLLCHRAVGPCRTQLRLARPHNAERPSLTRPTSGGHAGRVGGVGTGRAVVPSLAESCRIGQARHVAVVAGQTVLTLGLSQESRAVVEGSCRAGLGVLGLCRAVVALGANVGVTCSQARWGGRVGSAPGDRDSFVNAQQRKVSWQKSN